MRGSRKRKEGRVSVWRSVPAPEGRERMLLSRLWARVHATGRASWSMRLWVCNFGAS